MGLGHYPHLRVQRSPDRKMAEDEASTPQSSEADARTFSGGHSRTSSDGQIVKVPYFDGNFTNNNVSPRILMSHSSDSYSDHGWEEIEKQSNGTSEDICREVRCIETEELSNKCDSICSEENTEFAAVKVYENDCATKDDMESEVVETKEERERESSSPPSKEERQVSTIERLDFPCSTHEYESSSLPSFFNFKKSRSCRARIASSTSPWFGMMDFSEMGCGSERGGYVDEKKFSPLSFTPFVRNSSRKGSRFSPENVLDVEIDAPDEKLSTAETKEKTENPTEDLHIKNQVSCVLYLLHLHISSKTNPSPVFSRDSTIMNTTFS